MYVQVARSTGFRTLCLQTSDLVSDLDKCLRLVGLQTLSFWQQPQVVKWLVVATRTACLLPLHSPCSSVVATQEVPFLLHTAGVVFVKCRCITIDKVQKTGIVGVRRERERCPGDVGRSAGGRQCCVSPGVDTRVLTLQSGLRELVV